MKKINKQFEFFKQCCLEYADKFELNNWTFRFLNWDKQKNKNFEGAGITRTIDNCQADISFDLGYHKNDKEEIRKSAKHEILHCLTGKLYLLGKSRYLMENEIEREEEELVHKLEKLIK